MIAISIGYECCWSVQLKLKDEDACSNLIDICGTYRFHEISEETYLPIYKRDNVTDIMSLMEINEHLLLYFNNDFKVKKHLFLKIILNSFLKKTHPHSGLGVVYRSKK